MQVRAYLGTTDGKAAQIAKEQLDDFSRRNGCRVLQFYVDQPGSAPNHSRSRLFELLRQKGLAIASLDKRASSQSNRPAVTRSHPALFELLESSRPGDVLLLQHIRVIASLNDSEWSKFRAGLKDRKLRLAAMDVDASSALMFQETTTVPMAAAVNATLLDMVNVLARSALQETRKRQLEGIAKARSQGKYRGRPVDVDKHERILRLLDEGLSWSDVCTTMGVSRSTIARVVKANTNTAKAG